MSILSVDNISPIGSGTSVTVNSAATLVVNNVNSSGVTTLGSGGSGRADLQYAGATKLQTTGVGIAVDGKTDTNYLDVNIMANVMKMEVTGISTFAAGVNVSGGQIDVGSNIKLGNAGVVTATTFSGSGASLTNLPAGQLTGTVADARITTLTASKLTGALPAIDGSNLTGISAGGSGDYVHISTTNISSATASVEITLPTGYDRFEFMFDFYSSGRAHVYMQFSENNGSSYLTNAYVVTSQNNSYQHSLTWTSSTYSGAVMPDRSVYSVGSVRIFRASQTSNTRFISFSSGFDGGSFNGTIQSAGGMSTAQTARINKVKFLASGSYTFDSGKIALYGIKDT